MSNEQEQEQERSLVPVGLRSRGLRTIMNDMDRLLGSSLGWPVLPRSLVRPLESAFDWFPDIDVLERDNKIVVRADLPGINHEDIEVTVQDGRLVLRGHREEEQEITGETYYGSERATGRFYRAIGLPDGINPADVEASYKNGVLEVSIPKKEMQEPRKIVVNAE